MARIANPTGTTANGWWGHSWLKPLYDWIILILLPALNAGAPILQVDAVITAALGFTYANGTAGKGATLTGTVNTPLGTQDGVAQVLNKLYLVTNEAAPANNGYYKLTQLNTASLAPVLTRVSGFDLAASILSQTLFGVRSGTVQGNTTWKYTGIDAPVMGTTALTFAPELPGRLIAIADPGTAQAIPVTRDGVVNIVTAAAETNTLANPLYIGQRLILNCDTRSVGNRVVTAANSINAANNTIMTLAAAGQHIELVGATVAGALRWRVNGNDGVALS